jgi:hypothetical protein
MTLQPIIDEFYTAHEEILALGQQKLKEVFRVFWDSNPNIKLITWTQYTPYFNDGDTCEFDVCDVTFSNCDNPDEYDNIRWGEYNGDDSTIWATEFPGDPKAFSDFPEKVVVNNRMVVDLRNFLYSKQLRNVLLSLFGDHSQIFATREGFHRVKYDHE